jgi:hypothetical protein
MYSILEALELCSSPESIIKQLAEQRIAGVIFHATQNAGLDFIRGLRVEPAELGGDAGLVGAAYLANSAR